MLVLTRKPGETVVINGDITITVVEVVGGKVRLGIVAPKEVSVNRGEIQDRIDQKLPVAKKATG